MRIRSPSSRARINIRFSLYDVVLAAASPFVALYIRDAYILSADGAGLAGIYCLVSLACSLIAFAAFRVHSGIARYYSVHDIADLVKAVVIGELMTCVVLFTFTRLEGIPRSTPAIHALILGVGLVTARALAHLRDKKHSLSVEPHQVAEQHTILIGVNDLSVLYLKFLEVGGLRRQRVIAFLDEEPRWIGRSVHGVRVFGPPAHLASLIEEFAIHGVRTDRVVVGGAADKLSDETLADAQRVCTQYGVDFMSVPQLFNAGLDGHASDPAQTEFAFTPGGKAESDVVLPRYFQFKRPIDFAVALAFIVALAPLWLVIALIAFLDVGSPIVFWQQRIGMNGHNFLLYKIRTLRPAFDRSGHTIPDQRRVSWIGRLLRRVRFDEVPQLLNVLVGDMALIGPRPLLPRDQPPIPTLRLMVRPGITGWAQVNGGALLSPKEKEEFDETYVRGASPWFDLRIIALTIVSLVRGDRRFNRALAEPGTLRGAPADGPRPALRQSATSRFAAARADAPVRDDGQASAVRSG